LYIRYKKYMTNNLLNIKPMKKIYHCLMRMLLQVVLVSLFCGGLMSQDILEEGLQAGRPSCSTGHGVTTLPPDHPVFKDILLTNPKLLKQEPYHEPQEGKSPGDSCTNALPAVLGTNAAPHQPVWYQYTALHDAMLEVSSYGSGIDTRVFVYADCNGTLIGMDDDHWGYPPGESWFTWSGYTGITYYIFWDDAWSTAAFNWTMTEGGPAIPPPANDDCQSATWVGGPYPVTLPGSTIGALIDCQDTLNWNAVWYEVDLPFAYNTLEVDFCGTTNDINEVGAIYFLQCDHCADFFTYDAVSWYDCGNGYLVPSLEFWNIQGPCTIRYPVYLQPLMDFTISFSVSDATPAVISSFPYEESYEAGEGEWRQSKDDDMNWTRYSGETPSYLTGPPSAFNGEYYYYTEASGFYNKTAGFLATFDFSAQPVGAPVFDFWYHLFGAGMGTLSLQASTDAGVTWTDIWTMTGNQGDNWSNAIVSLAAYGNTADVMIRLWGTSGSTWASDMAFDYIQVYDQYAHDAGAFTLGIPVLSTPGTVIPEAGVKNYGSNSETFDVTLSIGSYTSVKTISGLAPGAVSSVTFDPWPARLGAYTAILCTSLAGDQNPANDCLTKNLSVENLTRVYGYSVYDPSATLQNGPVMFFLEKPETITLLALTTSARDILAGCWVKDTWYAAEQYSGGQGGRLWTINTQNGSMTAVGPMAATMNGLAYDVTTEKLYGVTSNKLYEINMLTGAKTLIGSMGTSVNMINLACSGQGLLYSVNIDNDGLYRINKSNGALTFVGYPGINCNYAQDMEFDLVSGDLYMTAFHTTSELIRIDPSTGHIETVGRLQGGAEITGFAIPSVSGDLKAYLEGPFNGTTMDTDLNGDGLLPLSQPYGVPPWNYPGAESVSSIPNAGVVDWVLVELRETTGGASTATGDKVIARRAGFILQDGSIRDVDGSNLVRFPVKVNANLHAVIYHRNHLSVMAGNALAVTSGIFQYDFSTGAAQAYGGVNGHKQIAAGIWGMTGADGNANKQVNNADKLDVWKPQSGTNGYKAGDFNMDSQVDNSDKVDVWKPNSGLGSQVPD